ncbi:hypothetical protein [Helicobacter pylori]|nr:hypothetical protein [Helicobacter pylori]
MQSDIALNADILTYYKKMLKKECSKTPILKASRGFKQFIK